MFTLSDVLNIAVQIEKNGEDTYRRVASQVKDLELVQMFQWMADEEKRHGELFAAIIGDRQLSAEQAELEAMGRSLLQDIVRSQTFSLEEEQLARITSLEDLLTQSIEFENDTIDFYEFLLGFLDDPEAVKQLGSIIGQERGHVKQLEEMQANSKSLASYEIEL
ncbi:MAG: ferritin family protein [Desulfobulbus sp.]|nr:ferritin family protein [Desulfobulbus sp.]